MIVMTNGVTATKEFRELYNELILNVFGFSFEKWHKQDVWNEDYECYSIFDNGCMIANVSVYKMRLLLNGIQREYLQFGAVATREEYRGKGLSRTIMEHILGKYPDTQAFLLANDSVVELYPKFGFKPTRDKQPYLDLKLDNAGEMRGLTVLDTRLDAYMRGRNQHSKIFDCLNSYGVNWFHLLYSYQDSVYEIPELDALVIARQRDRVLRLVDVMAQRPIHFNELLPYLFFENVEVIEFGFNPDWLGIKYKLRDYEIEDTHLFVKGDFGVEGYILPLLIRT